MAVAMQHFFTTTQNTPHPLIPNPISVIFSKSGQFENLLSGSKTFRVSNAIKNPFHSKTISWVKRSLVKVEQPLLTANPKQIMHPLPTDTLIVSKKKGRVKGNYSPFSKKYCNIEILRKLPIVISNDSKRAIEQSCNSYIFPSRNTMLTPIRLFSKIKKKQSCPVLELNVRHLEQTNGFPMRAKKPIQFRNLNLLLQKSNTVEKFNNIKSNRMKDYKTMDINS